MGRSNRNGGGKWDGCMWVLAMAVKEEIRKSLHLV